MNTIDEKLLSLFELSFVLSQMDNYDAILTTITRKASDFLQAQDAHLELINPITQQTMKTVMHNRGNDSRDYRKARTLVSGWILKYQKVCHIPNAGIHELFKGTSIAGKLTGAVLGVPLRSENRLIGALLLLRAQPFSQADIQFSEKLMAIITPFFRDVTNLQKYFAVELPVDTLRAKYEKIGLIGKSDKFIGLLKSIDAVAHTDVRVLLEGERARR